MLSRLAVCIEDAFVCNEGGLDVYMFKQVRIESMPGQCLYNNSSIHRHTNTPSSIPQACFQFKPAPVPEITGHLVVKKRIHNTTFTGWARLLSHSLNWHWMKIDVSRCVSQ